jgi:hypothetical protein
MEIEITEGAGQEAINRVTDAQDHYIDLAMADVMSVARAAREEYSRRLGQLDDTLQEGKQQLVDAYDEMVRTNNDDFRTLSNHLSSWVALDQDYARQSAAAARQYHMDICSATDTLADRLADIL